MNRERLQRVADLMRSIDPAKFDLDVWQRQYSCGTVACAVGYAAFDPAFIAEGFTLQPHAYPDEPRERGWLEPRYQDLTAWDAVNAFFDIEDRRIDARDYYYDEEEVYESVKLCNYFFVSDYYPNLSQTTPLEVTERIEAYLKEHA